MRKSVWLVAAASMSLASAAAAVDNWPHWRGPTHHGISHEKNIPVE